MTARRVAIIGAGAGGLAAAVLLAHRGLDVTVLEAAADPGGKIRQLDGIDAGPTVMTMKWVFEALFADAGEPLADHLTLRPLSVLARHAWRSGGQLDLFADADRSAEAIGDFAGAAEARGFRDFCARAGAVYRTLEGPFIKASRPTSLSLAAASGIRAMVGISPFTTLWKALGEHFRDPRLRQLFGRYATYSGASPFAAPATLMLIAHVEQQGVWSVDGGMMRVAAALSGLAIRRGAHIRCRTPVRQVLLRGGRAAGVMLDDGERIEADAVICAADHAALAAGLFGQDAARATPRTSPKQRSLSAVTWAVTARTGGFPLIRHNVFFSAAYQAEFDEILRDGRLPSEPTVYVCAQDRGDPDQSAPDDQERLLVLVNAPPTGDRHVFSQQEVAACADRTFRLLERLGLSLRISRQTVATPTDFARLFPATGGALYGQAVHGPMAAFRRPASRSALPGLYLAGGSVHPGPGVPMAVLSGRQAASSVLHDLTSR
jgi:1-hydroxycarotenoid 3,4-desaturase